MNDNGLRARFFNKDLLIAASLFTLALALRLLFIGSKSFWGDELYAAGLMESSISDLVTSSFNSSPHPPLAFILPRIFAAILGPSEAGLRVLPALMSSFASVFLFLFVKKHTGRVPALIAALLWVLSPYSVSLGQEGWLYGTLACFGFAFIYVSDLAWNGNKPAVFLLVPLGLAGMLIQHLFFLFLAAGFLLYFTVPKDKRVPLRTFILLAVIMALVYTPFAFASIEQASLRAERSANADVAAFAKTRMMNRVPTVFARLIPGGIAGEYCRGMFGISTTSLIFTGSLLSVLVSLILAFFDRKLAVSLKIWMAGVLIIPLLLFLKEDPTVRHLSILWIPLGLAVSSLYSRFKPAAVALLLLAVVLLFPYYRITSFPYHRSDWRSAVNTVLFSRTEDQQLVILAGQNGGVAWDYYAGPGTDRIASGGETPYAKQATSSSVNPIAVVDSLLSEGDQVWVIHDMWGGPSGAEIAPGYTIYYHEMPSAHIEVLLFGN